jgi:hypothetical protein
MNVFGIFHPGMLAGDATKNQGSNSGLLRNSDALKSAARLRKCGALWPLDLRGL